MPPRAPRTPYLIKYIIYTYACARKKFRLFYFFQNCPYKLLYSIIMKKRRNHKETDYVNNTELRELVIKYNDMNPNDDGSWLDKYERTMKTKGKIDTVAPWIALRRQKYAEPRKHTLEFEKVSNKLFCAIKKIVEGRVACFNIPVEEKEDLIQECLLTVLKYLNRYREDLNTSAFAYITELVNNGIKLYLGEDNDSRWCRQPWNDITDDHMHLLYGVNENDEE